MLTPEHPEHDDPPSPPVEIIYMDEDVIGVHKQSGALTHRSRIAEDWTPSVMERLRDQVGAWVYPAHRLDRPTSGVLIFGRNKESARALNGLFAQGVVRKRYVALVRGYAPDERTIDHALKERLDRVTDGQAQRDKPPQEAVTHVRCLAQIELQIPVGKYPTTRYSLVEAIPITGRRHQIRRHLAHISHPIIGDTTHGRGEHNRFFRARFNANRLLLASTDLRLPHPITGAPLHLHAPLASDMLAVCQALFGDQCPTTLTL